MCGIFGYIETKPSPDAGLDFSGIDKQLEGLFRLSQTRGKEAAGLALLNDQNIAIHKDSLPAMQMMKSADYKAFWKRFLATANPEMPLAALGHTRLVTNGMQVIDANNQPVIYRTTTIVHNGIIVNDAEIWQRHPHLTRSADVDSEVFAALLDDRLAKSGDIVEALSYSFGEVYGETSIGALFADRNIMALATNTGSLYTCLSAKKDKFFFVSEAYIAEQVREGADGFEGNTIERVEPGETLIIDLEDLSMTRHSLHLPRGQAADKNSSLPLVHIAPKLAFTRSIEEKHQRLSDLRASMQRCTRCVLPETVPFIHFDSNGVCNYCHDHQPVSQQGRAALEEQIAPYRKGTNQHDCLVAFSGGRDSSYGLHVLKRELGMNPVAYTYDWGMVTDLARRNQARMCDKLGIEHLWVSADIRKKRQNIRANVMAWMKRPDLGMIPLFMAGDKQFFYHANEAMQQTGIDLMIFCMNELEVTNFKAGFANIPPKRQDETTWGISYLDRFRMISYYLKQYLMNPSYLNKSIIDTLFAYFAYYHMQKNYVYPFRYLEWNEDRVNDVLINEYDWEVAPDSPSTWRIGDGSAAFYNYIYMTVAGFSEFDTFRSNQIRENLITREEAMKHLEGENLPRWQTIQEYMSLIQVDFEDCMRTINKMPKLYQR